MSKRCLPLVMIALAACTQAVSEPAGPCTENFCLPAGTKITHTQAGPDFNVHDVLWNGEKFGIYEGNFPQEGGQGSRVAVKLSIDRKARIDQTRSFRSGTVDVHFWQNLPKSTSERTASKPPPFQTFDGGFDDPEACRSSSNSVVCKRFSEKPLPRAWPSSRSACAAA